MTSYRIFVTEVFEHDLKDLPDPARSKIENKLKSYVYPQLRRQPHFGLNIKKLKGWEPETWRYRSGRWRFFFEIDEKQKIVSMTTLDQRKDAYRI